MLLGTAVGAAVVYGIDEGDPMAVQKKVGDTGHVASVLPAFLGLLMLQWWRLKQQQSCWLVVLVLEHVQNTCTPHKASPYLVWNAPTVLSVPGSDDNKTCSNACGPKPAVWVRAPLLEGGSWCGQSQCSCIAVEGVSDVDVCVAAAASVAGAAQGETAAGGGTQGRDGSGSGDAAWSPAQHARYAGEQMMGGRGAVP